MKYFDVLHEKWKNRVMGKGIKAGVSWWESLSPVLYLWGVGVLMIFSLSFVLSCTLSFTWLTESGNYILHLL